MRRGGRRMLTLRRHRDERGEEAAPKPEGRRATGLERLEGDDRARVDDARNRLHLVADEMADVDVLLDVEFGENVEVAGDRIDFRSDLRLGQGVRHLIGAAERAFDLNEKSLHRITAPPCRSLVQQLRRRGPYPSAPRTTTDRSWRRAGRRRRIRPPPERARERRRSARE